MFSILQMNSIFQVIDGDCRVNALWPSPQFKNVSGVVIISIQFIIPLFILIYCYGRIVWTLTRRIDSKLHNTRTLSDKFQLAGTNTIKTLLLVALCFIICQSDNQIYYLMHNLGYKVDFNGAHYKFSILMVFLNSTVNPFIYLFKYQDYQKALKKCLFCTKFKPREESNVSSPRGTTTTNA